MVNRTKFNDALQIKTWAGGKHTWSNLIYMCPTYPVYVYTNEDAAIKDARAMNKKERNEYLYFYIELRTYDE